MSSSRISVVLPLLLPDEFTVAMTDFCIAAMVTQAHKPFELVIIETGSRHFAPDCLSRSRTFPKDYVYLHAPTKTSYVRDWNRAADAASGDYLVHMGNDVIVGRDWDAALLEPFDKYRDCGVTCTAAAEPGIFIGPRHPTPAIVEGMFAPMMMFEKGWRLDPAYEGGYSDADLIMRIYTAGKRAYRNCASQCFHFDRITWSRALPDRGEAQIAAGEKIFYGRWQHSPLMMYAMIRAGGVIYGREHESLLAPVKLRQ